MYRTYTGICAFLVAVAIETFASGAAAKEKFFEIFIGAGGGYEYYKITSASAAAIQNSLGPDCRTIECIKPDKITGNGGLWRVFGGVRLSMVGIGVDYRQSYLEGPVDWGQLMGDFWIFIPLGIFKPFFKVGLGFIHLKVRDIELAGTRKDGDLVKGMGLRGGGGLLIKPIRWISIGATGEIAGTYFHERDEATWGCAVDVTAHLIVHI